MPDETPQLYADSIDPVRRTSADELFLLTIEVLPTEANDDYGAIGGAFMTCWVNADDLRSAEVRALKVMTECHWEPHRFDDWSLVTRATYADAEPLAGFEGEPEMSYLTIFEEAMAEGEVAIFNTFPIEDEEPTEE